MVVQVNRSLSVFLNLSRWSAAFLVVFGHAAHFAMGSVEQVAVLGLLGRILYCLTNLGHAAVMVFFVISGYLVGGLTLNKWLKSGPNITDYAINRFSRIYTVLVPALTLGYLIDSAGMRWLNAAGLYSNIGQYHIGSLDAVGIRLGAAIYLGNLLMLEGTAVTSLGSNGPLWSLVYEWWYYCIFCLFAAGMMYRGWQRLALWSCLLVLIFVLPWQMLLWMLMWLVGVALFFAVKVARRKPSPLLGTAVILAALIALSSAHGNSGSDPEPLLVTFLRDLSITMAYSFALFCFSGAQRSLPFARFHEWAAGFSYSMYLFHFPVLLLLVAMTDQFLGWHVLQQPSLAAVSRILIMVIVLYGIGYLFSRGTERYTDSVKNYLKRHIARMPLLAR